MIVRLQGGLGNQLFQAAFGIARSERRAEPLYLHPFHLGPGCHRPYALGAFTSYPWTLTNGYEDFEGMKKYSEKSFAFDDQAEGQPKGTYFIGNWQSEKYFASHADQIRALFTLHKFLTPDTQIWHQKIVNEKVSCSIHVRRTDYLNVKHYHGMMDAHRYENAIEYIAKRSASPIHFFVFSDDPAWCKENFPRSVGFHGITHTFEVVDANGMGSGDKGPSTEHEDLFLMSQCTHAIIPNSSFGWWGAWLGDNYDDDRVVIAPKNWFTPGGPAGNFDTKDLIPERWIRL